MTTYIIGHQKPDTDAVVSAIALAYLKKNKHPKKEFLPVITHALNPETTFVFDKFNVTIPKIIKATDINPEDKVILVDHNEDSQRLEGLESEKIIGIVDHHKANINFNAPINLFFKPWGSTSTLVYHLMKQHNIEPDKTLSTLMLCAILSDTVGFKSATTTKMDEQYGKELADKAGIEDIEGLTLEIFKAKSDISSLNPEEIVTNDFKIFDFPKNTFIDQLETVEQEAILSEKKQDLLEAMEKVKQEKQVELLFVAITDILKVNTKLLILSDQEGEVAQKAFGGSITDGILDIGPKMSRKKEIAPAIEVALSDK